MTDLEAEFELEDITVKNVPKSLLFKTMRLYESISGERTDKSEVTRFSLKWTCSQLSVLMRIEDKEKKVPRLFMLRKVVRYYIFTKMAWTKNTSLDKSVALAREEWTKKVKADEALTTITMLEGLKELKGEELKNFVGEMEKELATIPVKQDGRGTH